MIFKKKKRKLPEPLFFVDSWGALITKRKGKKVYVMGLKSRYSIEALKLYLVKSDFGNVVHPLTLNT